MTIQTICFCDKCEKDMNLSYAGFTLKGNFLLFEAHFCSIECLRMYFEEKWKKMDEDKKCQID